MLINPRATHSFIYASLVDLLGLSTSLLQFDMLVSTPIGKSFLATRVVKDDNIVIGGRELHVDLILLKLHDFDIILGMDWLATHNALVDCFSKKVTFHIPGQPKFSFEGSSGDTPIQLISIMKAQSLVKKGREGYLAYIVGDDKDVKFEDIPIVRDFSNVFPEELHGLPAKREVEFTIEFVSETTYISKAPYRMAPLELKELKTHLQEILDRGFIKHSVSPRGVLDRFCIVQPVQTRLWLFYQRIII